MNKLFKSEDNKTPFDKVLVKDCKRLNEAVEMFTDMFTDVSKINRGETMGELIATLREAGRADLADQIVRGLQ